MGRGPQGPLLAPGFHRARYAAVTGSASITSSRSSIARSVIASITCTRVPGNTRSSYRVPAGPVAAIETEPTGLGDRRLPCGPAMPLSATA